MGHQPSIFVASVAIDCFWGGIFTLDCQENGKSYKYLLLGVLENLHSLIFEVASVAIDSALWGGIFTLDCQENGKSYKYLLLGVLENLQECQFAFFDFGAGKLTLK